MSEDNTHPHKCHFKGTRCSREICAVFLDSLSRHHPLPSRLLLLPLHIVALRSSTQHGPSPALPTNLSWPSDSMCTHPSLYLWWSDLLSGRGCKAPQLIPRTGSGRTLRYCTRLLRYIGRNNRLRHLN